MAEAEKPLSVAKQLREFFTLIIGSVLAACLCVAALVYYYGPTGEYLVRNILLSPEVISDLSYKDVDQETGSSMRYMFDAVDFEYVDARDGKWQIRLIPMKAYADFFNMVSAEKSLSVVTPETEALFGNFGMATLSLKVKPKAARAALQGEGRVFQEVHFANGSDFFRVELHNEGPETQWAYFRYEGIYDAVIKQFIEF